MIAVLIPLEMNDPKYAPVECESFKFNNNELLAFHADGATTWIQLAVKHYALLVVESQREHAASCYLMQTPQVEVGGKKVHLLDNVATLKCDCGADAHNAKIDAMLKGLVEK